jgi:hypothetical protein
LDDVLTSVDQAHLPRFLDLLHDEADNFTHLLLTTHYRPWREVYRYSRGPGGKVQLIELLPWTHQCGIRHTKTKLVVDELEGIIKLEPLERQIVASKAGILLEQLLDHLTLIYECKMPRRPAAKYTLGDFLSGMNSKLKKALKVTLVDSVPGSVPLEHYLEQALDVLQSMAWVRNEIGCHFNLDANTSDAEVKDFATKVATLANTLVCKKCGELPRNENSGFDRRCRCRSLSLSPLRQPN